MYINKNIYKDGKLYLTYKNEEKVVLFDVEDYEKVAKFHWRTSKKKRNFYACTGQNKDGNKIIYFHNLVMDHTPNKITEVDHKNSNSLDNRKSNLRVVSRLKNIQNVSVRSDNKSTGIRGISVDKRVNKFTVDFHYNNKKFYFKPMEKLEHAVYLRYLCELKFLNVYRSTSNDDLVINLISSLTKEEKLLIENYFRYKVDA